MAPYEVELLLRRDVDDQSDSDRVLGSLIRPDLAPFRTEASLLPSVPSLPSPRHHHPFFLARAPRCRPELLTRSVLPVILPVSTVTGRRRIQKPKVLASPSSSWLRAPKAARGLALPYVSLDPSPSFSRRLSPLWRPCLRHDPPVNPYPPGLPRRRTTRVVQEAPPLRASLVATRRRRLQNPHFHQATAALARDARHQR